MTKFSRTERTFLSICGVMIVVLIVVALIIYGLNSQNKKLGDNRYLSLDGGITKEKVSVNGSIFSDNVCSVSFEIPAGMNKSLTTLPLPQDPLSQVVFDDGINKSAFSYICYDDKYTFDQFSGSGELKTEVLTVGNKSFSRAGNFVYFNKGDKLIIFQMFFTKNDLEAKSGYEEKLMKVLESVS